MSDVYILGVDMIKFGRFPEKTVPQIGAHSSPNGIRRCRFDYQRYGGTLLR